MRTIRQLYTAFENCEVLEDEEILQLYNHVKTAQEYLYPLGQKFSLAEQEVFRLYVKLSEIAEARGLDYD